MTQPRVLITGAGGFIGRHLVRHQLAHGRSVRVLDTNTKSLSDIHPQEGLEIVVGDVADLGVQRQAVTGIDVVFHLASAHLEIGLPDAAYHRINVAAVGTLLEESRKAGVQRFVHVSSGGVHGTLQDAPANEDAPFRPQITYERTKLAGELLAREFHSRYGFSVVIVRPVWVYGPGCKRTARLFQSIADGKFVMVGQGLNLRSAIYISDLLNALELCATRQGVDGEVFIATHDERVTVGQIVDEVARLVSATSTGPRIPTWLAWSGVAAIEVSARLLGKQPPVSRRSLKFFTNSAGFTCAKAREMLGFKPEIPLRTGLELTYQWWRESGRN